MASRRSLLALFVAGFCADRLVLAADARRRRVGLLMSVSQDNADFQARAAAFSRALRELGWVEHQNLELDIRYAGGSDEAIRRFCREWASARPDVVAVVSNQALAIVRDEHLGIPTVFIAVSDPVGGGFVASLSRPGGEMTGFTNYDPATGAKWLEVLFELAPSLSHVGILLNTRIAANVALASSVESAAAARGVGTTRVDAREAAEMEQGLELLARQRNTGLVVMPNPSNTQHQRVIIELAARQRLPTVYPFQYMARSGGLVAYGIQQLEQYRGAAGYVDRILRGARPGDLPVQQPNAYELVINLRTARALGLKPSPALLARASEVLE